MQEKKATGRALLKIVLFALSIIIVNVRYVKAQHCHWCYSCSRILIVKIENYNPNHEYVVFLTNKKNKPFKDIYHDTVFFAQQIAPYKSEIHPMYKNHGLPDMDTLKFVDFAAPEYFIALFQYCWRRKFKQDYSNLSFNICVENKTLKQKQFVKIGIEKFLLLCTDVMTIDVSNNTAKFILGLEKQTIGESTRYVYGKYKTISEIEEKIIRVK